MYAYAYAYIRNLPRFSVGVIGRNVGLITYNIVFKLEFGFD